MPATVCPEYTVRVEIPEALQERVSSLAHACGIQPWVVYERCVTLFNDHSLKQLSGVPPNVKRRATTPLSRVNVPVHTANATKGHALSDILEVALSQQNRRMLSKALVQMSKRWPAVTSSTHAAVLNSIVQRNRLLIEPKTCAQVIFTAEVAVAEAEQCAYEQTKFTTVRIPEDLRNRMSDLAEEHQVPKHVLYSMAITRLLSKPPTGLIKRLAKLFNTR